MRVLEARFHPNEAEQDAFVVIGHVVWAGDAVDDHPEVKPSPSVDGCGAPSTMLAKLRFLVANTSPETFARLQLLKSRYWSFVEVPFVVPPQRRAS
jgi:hypothetical protein